MAALTTKFDRNDTVFLKHNGKIYGGIVLSIDATLGIWEREWKEFYDIQTGEESGIDHIPAEHLFKTREEAEADIHWENRCTKFIGYRGL